MRFLLLLKGGPGSGNFGHLGRPGLVGGSAPVYAPETGGGGGGGAPATPGVPPLPSSSSIAMAAEAKAYWQQHIAGKSMALTTKVKAGEFAVKVNFNHTNTHMWTREAKPGETPDAYDRPREKGGPRVFDLERAVLMDRLFSTIAAPWKVLPSIKARKLYLGARLPDGGTYLVVLEVENSGECSFVSAHPRPPAEIARLVRDNRPALPAGKRVLTKSNAPPDKGGAFYPNAGGLPGRSCSQHLTEVSRCRIGGEADPSVVARTKTMVRFFELFKALAAGERWITIHPHGREEKGQPVLIQQQPDGSAKVVGGAGGKLNHLRLTGVKSEADYKQERAASAAARAEEKKRQRQRDKEAGLAQGKKAARESLRHQLAQHEAEFVQAVAKAAGWAESDMRFPEEQYQNASPEAQKRAAQQHARALVKRAHEVVEQQRQRLLTDAGARAAAGLGEVPLTAGPEALSVQDLDPVEPAGKGLGFATEYGKRAEAAGLTEGELREEAAAAKPAPARPPAEGEPSAAEKRRAASERIAGELKAIREPGPKVDPRAAVEAKQAAELLRAQKALRQAQKAAREEGKRIDGATEPVEPKAFVLEVGGAGDLDAEVKADLENDFRTLKTRAFLSEVGKVAGGADSLGRHVGVGAYNSINAVALAAGGASIVDRSVVDVLGIAGASQVLARRLAADLTPEEMGQVREAMGRFHVDHYMRLTEDSLREAREAQEAAAEIEVGEAATGAELAVAQEMNARRRDLVQQAQRVLGQAMGEMEANAALVVALERPAAQQVQASLGRTSIEDAIKQARAIGLERGDYRVERVGASTMLTVNAAGLDKLAQPVAKADLERVKGALDIIEGRQDEDGWLPAGVAHRPESVMQAPPGVAPRLAKAFPQAPGDVGQAIRDYIGGRAADGDAPADIMAGLLSEDTLQRAGDREAFMAALAEVAPLYDAEGQMVRAEAHAARFDQLADDFVARRYGADRSPLQRQQFQVDQVAVDALHAALAAHPDGVLAFKPVGDLDRREQGALRAAFAREYGRADPEAEKLRAELEAHTAAEPERETDGLFGRETNPAWTDWSARRAEMAEAANKATMTWAKYLQVMGGPAPAYAAMQDVIRSNVLREFADAHNRARPGAALKVGRTVIAHDLNHLDALDPEARERRLAEHRDTVDRLRNRVAGRYAAGGVADKVEAARAAEEAAAQAQMGLFGEPDPPPATPEEELAPAPEKPLELGQRWSIGHAAERQVAGMMPIVGANFRPGQPVKLWSPNMSGKFAGRQRAVKLIRHNRRTMLGLGVGSGKTSISLAGFTDLHATGDAKRGLFLVPSVVQGQFHGEALTLLEPGKYRWHCDPGADREARIAAYKDPSIHFNVVTHQAFRDDMLHLAARREGAEPATVAEKLDAMTPDARRDYLRGVMQAEGIDHDYLAVDEGHNLLNRQGKQNSHMANVVDAVSDGMGTYVNMTADPVKNDASEAFDVLSKMDRARYSDRAAFMRRYGVDTPAAKDALRREMARHFYTGQIDPGVKAERRQVKVQLAPGQQARVAALDEAAAKAKLARMSGKVDVAALRTLSPSSFEGVPEAQHQAVAEALNRSIGIVHNTALEHAVNGEASTEAVARIAAERKGKQGVVFVHHLDRVGEVAARLKADGHRVVTLTGADSTAEKDRKKRQYQAGEHDIIVLSDAGAVGANLQRGKWLVQHDTPMTAMTHAQRNGRIHRIGQTEDVELLDVVPDHPSVQRARDRLEKKYELRSIMTSPLEGLDDRGVAGYLNRVRAGQEEAAAPVHEPPAPAPAPEEAPRRAAHPLDFAGAFALGKNGGTADLRNRMWEAHQAGKGTVSGVAEPALAAAEAVRQRGGALDREGFEALAEDVSRLPRGPERQAAMAALVEKHSRPAAAPAPDEQASLF